MSKDFNHEFVNVLTDLTAIIFQSAEKADALRLVSDSHWEKTISEKISNALKDFAVTLTVTIAASGKEVV